MPEVIFTGPAGRLEGRFHPSKQRGAPIAVILHPHPQFGGTMNNQIVYQLYYAFAERGFSVLRFNFRGVGRSQGSFDHGAGELSDAASALDWVQSINPDARACWIAGVSFGAWIGMQLLMRRPEIEGFISIAPARQPVRLLVPRALPLVRPVRARRPGSRRAAEGSHGPHRKAEDPARHPHRACGRAGREPFLREPRRRTDRGSRRLSRPAPRQSRRSARRPPRRSRGLPREG